MITLSSSMYSVAILKFSYDKSKDIKGREYEAEDDLECYGNVCDGEDKYRSEAWVAYLSDIFEKPHGCGIASECGAIGFEIKEMQACSMLASISGSDDGIVKAEYVIGNRGQYSINQFKRAVTNLITEFGPIKFDISFNSDYAVGV